MKYKNIKYKNSKNGKKAQELMSQGLPNTVLISGSTPRAQSWPAHEDFVSTPSPRWDRREDNKGG